MKIAYMIVMSIIIFSGFLTGLTFIINLARKNNSIVPYLKYVDNNIFYGKWYELYRIENYFDKDLISVYSEFYYNGDYLNIIKKGFNVKKNEYVTLNGLGYFENIENSKFIVYYNRRYGGEKWIPLVGYGRDWFVLCDPFAKYFWIYSRYREMNKSTVLDIFEQAKTWGVNLNKIIKVEQ